MTGESLSQKNILPVIIQIRTGNYKNYSSFCEETREYLFSLVSRMGVEEGRYFEGVVEEAHKFITENLHVYNPKETTYIKWSRDVLEGYLSDLTRKNARKKHDVIQWEYENVGNINTDPQNSVYLKVIRKYFLKCINKISPGRERKALLLSFQKPFDMGFWAELISEDKKDFENLFLRAIKNLKNTVFEEKSPARLFILINLISGKLSGRKYITEKELSSVGDEEMRDVIKVSLEKESLEEALSVLGVDKKSYFNKFFTGLRELHNRLSHIETAGSCKADNESEDKILSYRKHLVDYNIGYSSDSSEEFNSKGFKEYKKIMDFLYVIFSEQAKPLSMNELLRFTIKKNASDLHLSAGMPPILRIDGDIYRVGIAPIDGAILKKMIEMIMNDEQREIYNRDYEIDFSYELSHGARFRVNAFHQYRGSAIAFRAIPAELMSLKDIGHDRVIKRIVDSPSGLILVTGPTGSGKTTTLSAMIEYKNKKNYLNILTIEDPVEYLHESKKCLINQREVHKNTRSFSAALRSALREDPDIILIGEMRDLETIKLALTAAETGHLVLATLHTNSAPQAIDRIIDVFPANEKGMVRFMLAESLQAVISQTLIKKKTGGRVAALEIMIANDAIRNLIREEKISQMYSTIQLARAEGMQTLEQHLKSLVEKGIIDSRSAYKKAANKKAFKNQNIKE